MRIFQNHVNAWHNQIPPASYCRVVNVMNSIFRKKHRISPAEEGRVFLADDGKSRVFFCRRRRGNQFKRGVMMHVDQLAGEYHLDRIDVASDGVFIDCGANIGELGIWARERGLRYMAFEPEEPEAHCCDLNNFNGRADTRREALWKETAMIPLYSKPESGDSSLIDMGGAIRTRIQAVALDDAVNLSDVPGTVILKIEAEGAEPEVLEGAANTLASIDWVAIDCGHERGVSRTHTFVETNVLMQDLGFRLHRAQFKRITALYRNMKRRSCGPPGSSESALNTR